MILMPWKLRFAQLGHLYKADVTWKCASLWILELSCHIEGNTRRIHLGWTKSDVTDGRGVKCTAGRCLNDILEG